MATPEIKPRKSESYSCTQSRYENVDSVPFRGLLLGPSGSGKSTLLQSMILDIYDRCFERMYIWSPSIHIDPVWYPVKSFLKKVMKQDNE